MKPSAIPIIVLLLLAPTTAKAESPPIGGADPVAAERLFYEARTLMGQNKWSEACPKLDESLRLDPGLGTAFNLADCNEHLGKLMTAWAGFVDVATQSRAKNQPDREKLATKRAQALEPRLPKLYVEVKSPAQGLEVKRDGAPIEASTWNTPVPIDPGTHRLAASAPGRQSWETTVESREGITARVIVPGDLPQTGVATTSTRPSEAAMTTTASADTVHAFPPAIVESTTQRTLGWIVTGVGAAGVGVGAGFGLSSLGKRDESKNHCVGEVCDPTGMVRRDEALEHGNIATIATIAGGAAVLGGLILVLTAPSSRPRTRSGAIRAVPNASLVGGGFTFQGAF